MTLPHALTTRTITIATLIRAARDLRSEHGENPEYDRALVELIYFVSGADDPVEVEEKLGIKRPLSIGSIVVPRGEIYQPDSPYVVRRVGKFCADIEGYGRRYTVRIEDLRIVR